MPARKVRDWWSSFPDWWERWACEGIRVKSRMQSRPKSQILPTIRGRVRVSDTVHDGLERLILMGALEPGLRLLEAEIADRYGTSRTPVREALKRLSAQGLIRADPVRGVVVRGISERELDEVLSICEVLDGLAARLSAAKLSSSDLAEFHEIMEGMEASVRTARWEAACGFDTAFHKLLSAVGGNSPLRSVSEQLIQSVHRFSIGVAVDPGRLTAILSEHEEIVRALASRDGDHAEQVARHHASRTREFWANRNLMNSMRQDA